MLQCYSIGQAFATGAAIPFNNIAVEKGKTAVLAAPATIELNKKGVYEVCVDGVVTTATTADSASVQLTKNGIPLAGAQSSFETAVSAPAPFSFCTLIQVSEDNTCCCITSPTTLQVVYTGDATTGNINVVVTKIC